MACAVLRCLDSMFGECTIWCRFWWCYNANPSDWLREAAAFIDDAVGSMTHYTCPSSTRHLLAGSMHLKAAWQLKSHASISWCQLVSVRDAIESPMYEVWSKRRLLVAVEVATPPNPTSLLLLDDLCGSCQSDSSCFKSDRSHVYMCIVHVSIPCLEIVTNIRNPKP